MTTLHQNIRPWTLQEREDCAIRVAAILGTFCALAGPRDFRRLESALVDALGNYVVSIREGWSGSSRRCSDGRSCSRATIGRTSNELPILRWPRRKLAPDGIRSSLAQVPMAQMRPDRRPTPSTRFLPARWQPGRAFGPRDDPRPVRVGSTRPSPSYGCGNW